MGIEGPTWCDEETGDPLDLSAWPQMNGIPVLVPQPEAFLLRHGPRTGATLAHGAVPYEPLPVDAPDPLTPHLSPGHWPDGLLPPEPLGAWVKALGERCPDAVCSAWGAELAPEGPTLDVGCGVGGMARRMAESGRSVLAFDRSPEAVRLARSLMSGALPEVWVPMDRSRSQAWRWPHPPVAPGQIAWAVADVLRPPLPPDTLAWVHLGSVLDMVEAPTEAVIDALAPAIRSGGLLTVATPYDEDRVPLPDGARPDRDLRAVLPSMGFEIVAEDVAVPWVVRQYNRACRVLFVDCIAARVTW